MDEWQKPQQPQGVAPPGQMPVQPQGIAPPQALGGAQPAWMIPPDGVDAANAWMLQEMEQNNANQQMWDAAANQMQQPQAVAPPGAGQAPVNAPWTTQDPTQYGWNNAVALHAAAQPKWDGYSMSDFEADPGYQFRQAEGQKAIERSAAARSGVHSGATMKALQAYGQQVASQEYNAARARALQDYATAGNEYAMARQYGIQDHQMNRSEGLQDYDLARQNFYDQIGLEDRARGHAYQDRAYEDAAVSDEYNRLMQLAGFGQAGTSAATQTAAQIGSQVWNARQYGVEGMGAAHIGAANAHINQTLQSNAITNQAWNNIIGIGKMISSFIPKPKMPGT